MVLRSPETAVSFGTHSAKDRSSGSALGGRAATPLVKLGEALRELGKKKGGVMLSARHGQQRCILGCIETQCAHFKEPQEQPERPNHLDPFLSCADSQSSFIGQQSLGLSQIDESSCQNNRGAIDRRRRRSHQGELPSVPIGLTPTTPMGSDSDESRRATSRNIVRSRARHHL